MAYRGIWIMTMNVRSMLLPLLVATAACGASTPAPTSAPTTPAVVPAATAAAPPQPAAMPAEDDAVVPITPHNPTWGNRTALVTVVEYSDLQCPFCQRVLPTLAALRETYGPDKLRIVWKNNPLPFHPNARPAAEAAAGVFELGGARAFWAFHDLVFQNQGSMNADNYELWARQAGVTDTATLRAGLASHRWADAVDADLRDATNEGVQGTPSFFINGVFVVGAQPIEKFKSTIDAELVKAQAKLDAGTPRERVYAEMARENRANAPKQADEPEEPADDTATVFKMPVGTSPGRGGATPLVTIVEFADFQCPFSARVEPTLEAIRAKYADKVRIVWKNEPLPFHPNAEPAAQAALEVRSEKGDAAFWSMHDKLFAAQKDLSQPVLAKLAGEVGANPARVLAAVKNHARAKEIEADKELADDFQANGTPHFFINGRRLVGAQPEEKFDRIIDEEIVKAQGLLAKGTAPSALYDALVKAGVGPAEPERKTLAILPAHEPTRGAPAAKVTVHEWADFQCPFCGRAEETITHVMKDYGTRVKLVWHDLPLSMHPDAPLAAEAGREAFQQKGSPAFWSMHDLMFGDQQKLKRDSLDLYARSIGLDMQKWATSLDNKLHEREIEAEKHAAEEMDINGTPAFVIVPSGTSSGYFLNGAQPYSKFHKLIERALTEAK